MTIFSTFEFVTNNCIGKSLTWHSVSPEERAVYPKVMHLFFTKDSSCLYCIYIVPLQGFRSNSCNKIFESYIPQCQQKFVFATKTQCKWPRQSVCDVRKTNATTFYPLASHQDKSVCGRAGHLGFADFRLRSRWLFQEKNYSKSLLPDQAC